MEKIKKRFLEKVRKTKSCWIWTAYTNRLGYGSFRLNQKMLLAHRVSYELFVGKIPNKLTLDHLCKQPSCVNPNHLEAVSSRVNILRGNTLAAANLKKTHCKRGHGFTKSNTYLELKKSGRKARRCIQCNNLDSKKYHWNIRRVKNAKAA